MTEAALTIDDLTPDAQRAAVSGFAKFYLNKYTHEGLDVLAQRNSSGHIADINQWLVDNVNFSSEEKLTGLITSRYDNLVALLKALKTPFNNQGIPAEPWADWFDQQLARVVQGR
ncbi:hypothetical protein [Lacticaseibacillus absianus]|uniref:hypothetical protein n=1 Tax=Lacticaseibacillus absianus TaxID=2729623 RepID=UPI0015CEE9BA|nr:hypothetical protein [Lacticaseibacillus absianus]